MKVLTGLLLAGLAASQVYLWADATSSLPKLKAGDPLPANLFVELAKAVNPAVVNIYTTYLPKRRRMMRDPYRDPFFDMFEQFMIPPQQAAPQESLGTGFLIREDGLIVTNNHVVDQADVIKVQLDERKKGESFDAKLVGKDAKTDIALIKITAKRKLPFVRIGSSADVQVGEWVAAFGNPYGYGHTVTKGIISAVGREIDELNLFPFMQTDASINPGNSGGPLVNTRGEVIGVNTAIDARAQGIGFVIPIDNVKSVLPTLEKEGSIKRGMLGVILSDLDEEGAGALRIKQTEGALIADVMPNSPAEKAGLQPYDLVVEFQGQKVAQTRDLTKLVAATTVGQKVELKVIRNGQPKKVNVTIGSTEKISEAASAPRPGKVGGQAAPYGLGFVVADYSGKLAEDYHLPRMRQPRPILLAIQPGSEASKSGLAPGDIILDVNRVEVRKASDVIKNLKPKTINILRVLKQDRVVLISIRAR
ncbi:MAG: Do family serine endopeptidase [Bdellovibrionales bacterium]